jgi:hypothetical protein
MADQFIAGETFTEDEQVTHAKLNLAQTNLKFTSNAVDDSTTVVSSEAIIVKSGGITATQLATDSVTSVKIINAAVVRAKIGADSIDDTKIADNAIKSEHYTDGSIDEEHLSNDVLTGQAELTAAPADADDILLSDTSDSGNLKRLGIDTLFKHPIPAASPKAYGVVTFDTSTPALSSAYNCTLGTDDSDKRQILITDNMSSGNYVVQLTVVSTGEGDSVTFYAPYVYIRNAADFTIAWSNGEVSTRAISFVVFGTLAT